MIKRAIKYFKKLYLVTKNGTLLREKACGGAILRKGCGRWNKNREYTYLDIVRYRGMAYISKYHGSGAKPTDETRWVPLNVLKVYIKEIDE